ncbi:hypothetical protein BH10PSE13_BH10PSE13_18540 [soil metagenome]
MTDMAELVRRKHPLNLAIVHVDPEAFTEHYIGWLEITAFVTAVKLGEAIVPDNGVTPALTAQQLSNGSVSKVADDTICAFCMTAALEGNGAAVDRMEATLESRLGKGFPGHSGLWPFRGTIDAPVTLDDFVGQAGKKMLVGEIAPPPMRSGEAWNTGLRFLERALGSNFRSEIIYPLALWTRARWEEAAEKGVAFMAHIESTLPVLRTALEDPRNDAAFIANTLLQAAPAVDIELQDEVEGMLRSLARR